MTALTFSLFLCLWPVHTPELQVMAFPPEEVCEKCYKDAEQRYYLAKQLYEVGGSWPLKCQMDAVAREKDLFWSAWWVTWKNVTNEDRRIWVRRWRELLMDLPPPVYWYPAPEPVEVS